MRSLDNLPDMDFMRSEKMAFVQLIVPVESAHRAISYLGELGLLQFKDLNDDKSPFQRTFVNQVKRCGEMSRKLRFFKDQISKAGLVTSAHPGMQPDIELEELETKLAEHETELIEMNSNSEKLGQTYNELQEYNLVLQKAGGFLVSSKSHAIAETELVENVYSREDYVESASLLEQPGHSNEIEDDDDDLHPTTKIEQEVLSGGGTPISDFPKVIAHSVNRPHPSVIEIVSNERAARFGGGNRSRNLIFMENISHGQLQVASLVPRDYHLFTQQQEQDGASSSYVCIPPAVMEGQGVVKRYGNSQSHVVPMHADWFSPNSVNRLERQVVPHFFSGKSSEHTPEKYMECRNSIVFMYVENPDRRLSVNDCQGWVPGVDLHDLNRIVRFLDHWGIINYNAPAPNREPRLGAPYIKEDQNGDLHIHSAALKSIYSLVHFDKPKSRIRPEDFCSSTLSPGEEISDLDNRIRERLSDNHCNYCSRPLPPVSYQSLKEADVMLCLDCYHEGRFVAGHSSIDFTRMNSTKDFSDVDGDSWTDQETLLLLEALEIYNDNWTEIAEHVGTKSKAECILHFIRLPVEDGLLENIVIPSRLLASDVSGRDQGRQHLNTNGTSAARCLQDLDSESRLPFANSGNPVMALVAFISSALGPRVASACAHASLAALSKEDSESVTSEGIVETGDSVHGDRTNMESKLVEGRMRVQGSSGENHAHATRLCSDNVKNAAKLGLAAAAAKAKHFADHEEREIQRMTASIINHQLRKLDAKLKQFAEIETVLMKETEQVEKVRQRFAAERARIKTTGFVPSTNNIPGAASSALPNNTMNLHPFIAASTSQTNISGYGNNQSLHPQMSFMPRQSMFSFGPRLPLSAIHPSSSTPSGSTTFSTAPTNMGHPLVRSVSGTDSNVK